MGTKEYHAQKSHESYERKKSSQLWTKERQQYQAERRRQNKTDAVVKFGGVCAHCQGIFPDCVFEFHHIVHEEKEYSPSHLFHLSIATIERELAKCIMLCANCHRIEHMNLKYDAHSKRYDN